jgi:hypothetical protein
MQDEISDLSIERKISQNQSLIAFTESWKVDLTPKLMGSKISEISFNLPQI